MVGERGLVNRAGVVVKPSCDGQVDLKVFLRHAKLRQIGANRAKLAESRVEHLVFALVAVEESELFRARSRKRDKAHYLVRLSLSNAALQQQRAAFFRADLIQLVYSVHDVRSALLQSQERVKAV